MDKAPIISDEEILIASCANCTREDVWSDEDCKYCQMNMRVAARTQLDAVHQFYEARIAEAVKKVKVDFPCVAITKDESIARAWHKIGVEDMRQAILEALTGEQAGE